MMRNVKRRHFDRQIARGIVTSIKSSLKEVTKCGHHRSQRATLTEMAIRVSGFKKTLSTPTKLADALQRAAVESERPLQLPSDVKFTVPVKESEVAGSQCFTLNADLQEHPVIIYLTGGAFFERPLKEHWQFLNRLADRTASKVVVPIYPTLPAHTVEDAFAVLKQIYNEVYTQVPVSQVTVMGDSAGAGLAASFCEYLGERGLPQPGHLIMISPWLAIDFTNPQVAAYEEKDVTLNAAGLRQLGAIWAAKLDHRNWQVSPLYGTLSPLRDVTIFVGTEELMYPDAMDFAERLRQQHVPVTTHIGRNLYHIYPVYQSPESEQAVEEIKRVVNS